MGLCELAVNAGYKAKSPLLDLLTEALSDLAALALLEKEPCEGHDHVMEGMKTSVVPSKDVLQAKCVFLAICSFRHRCFCLFRNEAGNQDPGLLVHVVDGNGEAEVNQELPNLFWGNLSSLLWLKIFTKVL